MKNLTDGNGLNARYKARILSILRELSLHVGEFHALILLILTHPYTQTRNRARKV